MPVSIGLSHLKTKSTPRHTYEQRLAALTMTDSLERQELASRWRNHHRTVVGGATELTTPKKNIENGGKQHQQSTTIEGTGTPQSLEVRPTSSQQTSAPHNLQHPLQQTLIRGGIAVAEEAHHPHQPHRPPVPPTSSSSFLSPSTTVIRGKDSYMEDPRTERLSRNPYIAYFRSDVHDEVVAKQLASTSSANAKSNKDHHRNNTATTTTQAVEHSVPPLQPIPATKTLPQGILTGGGGPDNSQSFPSHRAGGVGSSNPFIGSGNGGHPLLFSAGPSAGGMYTINTNAEQSMMSIPTILLQQEHTGAWVPGSSGGSGFVPGGFSSSILGPNAQVWDDDDLEDDDDMGFSPTKKSSNKQKKGGAGKGGKRGQGGGGGGRGTTSNSVLQASHSGSASTSLLQSQLQQKLGLPMFADAATPHHQGQGSPRTPLGGSHHHQTPQSNTTASPVDVSPAIDRDRLKKFKPRYAAPPIDVKQLKPRCAVLHVKLEKLSRRMQSEDDDYATFLKQYVKKLR